MSQQQHVFLERGVGTDTCFLCSVVTHEVAQLGPGSWQIDWAETGEGFVYNLDAEDPDPRLVSEILRRVVLRRAGRHGADELAMLKVEGAAPVCLQEMRNSRVLRSVSLRLPPHDLEMLLDVALFPRSRAGFHLMWSMKHLHAQAKFSQFGKQSGMWCRHQWSGWLKHIERFGAKAPEHFLKAKCYEKEAAVVDSSRTLNFSSASTFALLVLASLWCEADRMHGGMVQDGDRLAAGSLLEALLRTLDTNTWDLHLLSEPHPPPEWPRIQQGSAVCVLIVECGVVQLSNLATAEAQHVEGAVFWSKAFEQIGDTASLREILRAMVIGAHMPATVLYSIVSQISRKIDTQISKTAVPGHKESCEVRLEPLDDCASERHMQEILTSYWRSCRRAVASSWSVTPFVSLCTDDSNVRGLELNNTAVILPNNTAVWAPAQVAEENKWPAIFP